MRLYEIPGKLYALYLVIANECQIEEFFYDFYVFCESNDCDFNNVFKNNGNQFFKFSGIINSFIEIYYQEKDEDENEHDFYFDKFLSIGNSLGKLLKISFAFKLDNPINS